MLYIFKDKIVNKIKPLKLIALLTPNLSLSTSNELILCCLKEEQIFKRIQNEIRDSGQKLKGSKIHYTNEVVIKQLNSI